MLQPLVHLALLLGLCACAFRMMQQARPLSRRQQNPFSAPSFKERLAAAWPLALQGARPACDASVYVCVSAPPKLPKSDPMRFAAMFQKRQMRVQVAQMTQTARVVPFDHPHTRQALHAAADSMFRLQPNYVVGEGGFCSVWLALGQDGGLVAVRDTVVPDQRMLSLALYEVLIAASVTDHTNLVRYAGAAIDEATASAQIAYEYVSLDTAVLPEIDALRPDRWDPSPTVSVGDLGDWGFYSDEARVVDMVRQILRALVHLHETVGAVHRDIKPGNVFVGNAPSDGLRADYPHGVRYKLGDLGIALPLDAAGRGVPLPDGTYDESHTPGYRAPELADGRPPGAAADVWALGRMALALVPGEAAHVGVSPAEVWVRASLLRGRVSDAFLHFLSVALCPDPALRHSARQLLAHPVMSVLPRTAVRPLDMEIVE